MTQIVNWIPPFGTILLVVILILVVYALISTYKYYIDRFSDAESTENDYVNIKAKLKQASADLEEALKAKENIINAINEIKENSKTDQAAYDKLQELLAGSNAELNARQSERANILNETAKLNAEKDQLDISIQNRKDQLKEIEDKIQNADKDNYEQIINEVNAKRDELKQLIISCFNKSSELSSMNEQIKQKKTLIDDYTQHIANLSEQYKQTKQVENHLEAAKKELELKQKDKSQLTADITEYSSRLETLKNELKKLDLENQENKSLDKFKDLFKLPEGITNNASIRINTNPFYKDMKSENDFLDEFYKWINTKYIFSSRTIKAFHTALKIQNENPLTVLAGISGTGKSLLPIQYAKYFGFYQLTIPVQPRWDSSQDLLGFYNHLEKKYQATELARYLIAFGQQDKKFNCNNENNNFDYSQLKDRILLVLLDEMNLARTEYYFAEFLSRLELRRLYVLDDDNNRTPAKISLDNFDEKIWVPNNILFVGTMNEDESTQTLSDKVLDRANVIRFGKPNDDNIKNKQDSELQKTMNNCISYTQWKKWIKDSDPNLDQKQITTINNNLKELNNAMAYVGHAFGYRVYDSIKQYIINYPKDTVNDFKLALADQIEQKIMPKLRGLDMSQQSTELCLNKIAEIIENTGDTDLADAFGKAQNSAKDTGMFMWQGVNRKNDN